MRVSIRAMALSDLPAMLALQTVCFPDLEPESETSLKAKLLASPKTCFVAEFQNQLMGYLITHPWSSNLPPALNAPDCVVPDDSDCLYVHDLSVHPDARGTGTSQGLFNAFSKCLDKSQFKLSALIAVQNSHGFWEKHGYNIVPPTEGIQKKLDSYGKNVHYMMKRT